jgi:ribonuclease D
MPFEFLASKPRDFSPASISGLTKEASDGVNAALKALTTWRNEVAAANEKNGKRVIDQMTAAASALKWPDQVVNAARSQLQSISDVQIKTMDQMVDAWEAQIRSPNPLTTSPKWSELHSLWGLDSGPTARNPIELWMQFMEQWQRAWGEAIGTMGKRH